MTDPTVICPKCGYPNRSSNRFCGKCATPLTTSYDLGWSGPIRPKSTWKYAPLIEAENRARAISRTKTGLVLLIIGILLGPFNYVKYVGAILDLAGALLVIIGRNPFGNPHSKYVIWSILLYIAGFGVVFISATLFTLSLYPSVSAYLAGHDSSTLSQSLMTSLASFAAAIIFGQMISGVGQVLLTYALQNRAGKLLLWGAYCSGITISIIASILLLPQLTGATVQAISSGNTSSITDFGSQLQNSSLFAVIPATAYAIALALVRQRIESGKLPTNTPISKPCITPEPD